MSFEEEPMSLTAVVLIDPAADLAVVGLPVLLMRIPHVLHRPVRAVHPVALPAPSEDLVAP